MKTPLLYLGIVWEGASRLFWSHFPCGRSKVVVLNSLLTLPFKCCFEMLLK